MEISFKDALHVDVNSEDIKIIENSLNKANDEYIKANSPEAKEYLCYLTAAIYLTYQRMYPDLSIYIPFRFKSIGSYMKNANKEAGNLSNTDESKMFEKMTADIMGATIVLDHIKSSRMPKIKYSSDKIHVLFEKKDDNKKFINEVQRELDNDFIDEKTYYEYERLILEKLIDSTYPEFKYERPIPYKTELENMNKTYSEKLKIGNFALSITKEQKVDLEKLLNDLRSRVSDKIEYEVLLETLPKVLNAPLLKNALKVDHSFSKDVKKENGFAAIYYTLKTPFGDIELQSQSNKRYYEAKKGSAFHSGIKGKEIDINYFFELVDENDPKDLKFYLDRLNAASVDKIVSDAELPNNEEEREIFIEKMDDKTRENYKYTKLIEELANHIKIKDTINFNSSETPTNKHLLDLAKHISPSMNVCSSGHTSFSTATISHKNLVNEFSEVLRKKDSNTYLANMLIDRLSLILKDPSLTDEEYKEWEKITNALPRDISKKDITDYADNLKLQDTERELD